MTGHGCLLWDGEKKAFLPNSALWRSSKKNINADIGLTAGKVLRKNLQYFEKLDWVRTPYMLDRGSVAATKVQTDRGTDKPQSPPQNRSHWSMADDVTIQG